MLHYNGMTEKMYYPKKRINLIVDRTISDDQAIEVFANIEDAIKSIGGSLTVRENPTTLKSFKSNIPLITGDNMSIDNIVEGNLGRNGIKTNSGLFDQFGELVYLEMNSDRYESGNIEVYGKNSTLNGLNMILTGYPLDTGYGSTSMSRFNDAENSLVRPIAIISSKAPNGETIPIQTLSTIAVHELGHMLGAIDEESIAKGYRTEKFDLDDGTGGHCTDRNCIMSQEYSLPAWISKSRMLSNDQNRFYSNPFCQTCTDTIRLYMADQHLDYN